MIESDGMSINRSLVGMSINRSLVRVGTLVQNATFSRGSILSIAQLDGEENDKLPLMYRIANDTKILRGILFGINQDNIAMDLINENLEYPIMNTTPSLVDKDEKYNNCVVVDDYSLDSLLEYLGFNGNVELTKEDLNKIRKILTRKSQIKKLALPCGYGKINIGKTSFFDYSQEVKLSCRNYYTFIGSDISNNERCCFDRKVLSHLGQEISPAAVFETLVKNRKLGYIATSK